MAIASLRKRLSGTGAEIMRNPFVKLKLVLLAACGVAIYGCGGDSGGGGFSPGYGSVSGVIYDQNGQIVRGAQVFFDYGGPHGQVQTFSDSNGAYILKGIPADYDLIQCQIASKGVTYFGQNLTLVSNGQRTMTLNIAVYPQTQLATLQGNIGDSFGYLLSGAKVYAIPTSGKLMTSAYGVTDNSGNYFISGLVSGTAYTIQATALGYGGVTDTQTFTAGQSKTVNYTLPPKVNTTLQPPTGVKAVAYTSPGDATTQPRVHNAIEAVKSIVNPRRRIGKPNAKRMTKLASGNPVEIDVSWNPVTNTSLLGFGIYSSDSGAAPVNIDFLGDPLASVYEDMYHNLLVGTTYTYAVTTVSTSVSGNNGESALSATAVATPLGPLAGDSVTATNLPTFSWQPAIGATSYAVFLFDQYPDIGVQDIWDNLNHQAVGTSFTYNGPALMSGKTYYYILVGFDGAGDQSLSPVGQFSVP